MEVSVFVDWPGLSCTTVRGAQKRIPVYSASVVAFLVGVLAVLVTFGTLMTLSRGLLSSGGGLLLASALAHVIGTTIAAFVATDAGKRSRLMLVLVFGRACLYTLVLLVSTAAAYAALALTVPRVLRSGLVSCYLV